MKFEMNMLTGKYNRICYEEGDVVVPKGAFGNISAPKSLILKKEYKHSTFSPDYLVFHEDKAGHGVGHGDSVLKHSMNIAYLRAFYEPYMNPLSTYK